MPTHHHQAVDKIGDGLVAVGWADDGIIEAVEADADAAKSFLVGVQWHPEQGDDMRLFTALVAAAEDLFRRTYGGDSAANARRRLTGAGAAGGATRGP